MSVILFFGFCFLVTLVSTVYVSVSIWHIVKNRKAAKAEVAVASSSGGSQ
jgi:hypothetical protein